LFLRYFTQSLPQLAVAIFHRRALETGPRSAKARRCDKSCVEHYFHHHLPLHRGGVTVFCQYVLERLNLHRLVGHDRLQPPILLF
jgi:hypothetical protein